VDEFLDDFFKNQFNCRGYCGGLALCWRISKHGANVKRPKNDEARWSGRRFCWQSI